MATVYRILFLLHVKCSVFKCILVCIVQQGCNFFHWELEYVIYLLDNEILRGDAAVEALGWAEDMRMELKLKAEEQAATTPGHEQLMRVKAIGLMEEAVLLLKIVVALLVLVCVLVAVKK